jgi:hypothetical protein
VLRVLRGRGIGAFRSDGEITMSTRACYRFIDPETAEVVTVYKHSDGYPEGAVCWITRALDFAWTLPRFEADEFAAAFIAANKSSAKIKRWEYLERAGRETNPETKNALLNAAEEWGPGGRYAGMIGGDLRVVNKPGIEAFQGFATDIEYLYDVTVKTKQLHVTAHSTRERDGKWTIKRIFSGALAQMQAKYGLKYLDAA